MIGGMADGDNIISIAPKHIVAPPMAVSNDFKRQLDHYRLTTAEILYHIPDHPKLLQSFIWQDLDVMPKFPVLRRFLNFWQEKLDGKLYQVRIAVVDHISMGEFKTMEELDLSPRS
jgi:uncharacterized protein Usg